MKQLVKGEIAAAELSYEVDLDAGKLEVHLAFDAAAELSKLEQGIPSPLIKSLVEMGILALKEV